MAEEEAEEVPEQLTPGQIARQCCVCGPSGEADSDYRVGAFEISPSLEEASVSVPVICISEVDNQLLVAVPGYAWHRTVSQRLLPAKALLRPISVAFATVLNSDSSTIIPDVTIKAWLAFLRPEFEESLDFETEAASSLVFTQEMGMEDFLPAAEALVQIAEDKFNFLSAVSGGAGEPEANDADQRIARLEESIIAIRSHLADLSKRPAVNPDQRATPKTAAPLPPKPQASLPGGATGSGGGMLGLDPQVVAAALNAGIERSHLEEFSKMMQQKKTQMPDLPKGADKRRKTKLDILGETDEEQEEEPVAAPDPSVEPVAAALVKLTKIVDKLSSNSRSKGKLLAEVMEDTGASTDGVSFNTSSGSSKRHAHVLRALRRALRESPGEIYEAMRDKLREDCGSRAEAPGGVSTQPTFRGWVEHRSRLPNINATVRTAWSIAGALDCLEQGRTEEAQCRLLLYLAMLDQVAIDRGSWVLAHAGALEDAPPFAAFGRHVLPDFLEPQHSKLWPSVWADAFMYQIREQDEFMERKSKLGRRQLGLGNQVADLPEGGAKGKDQKGKKGNGKGKNQSAGGQDNVQSAAASGSQ